MADEKQVIIKKRISKEDEYFAKRDSELVKDLRRKKEEDEQKKIKDLLLERKRIHYMKCPKCGMDLHEIEFKDVLIDRCPDCRGIWLDKGELETLLTKEARFMKQLFKGFFKDPDFEKL